MTSSRPKTPLPTKRQLRQESGFGCCNCGHPFIEYHHIIPWAEEQHFRAEDMMTLCKNCHDLCTTQALTENQQRALKSKPRNIQDNFVRGLLYANAKECIVKFGGGTAINTPRLLTIRGKNLLSVAINESDCRILVSAVVHDANGTPIGQIVDNEWEFEVDKVWDLTAKPKFASAQASQEHLGFEIDARRDEILLNGRWTHLGESVEFSPTAVLHNGNRMFGSFTSKNSRNFICIM